MKKTSLFFLANCIIFAAQSQVFTKIDSIKVNQAQIWGVLSDQGDSLCLTTTFSPGSKPQVYLRKVSYNNINSSGTLKQITFDSDFASIPNLTDHKHIILNNQIYVSFSTQGDDDMFLFKTDIHGNRIGNIITVVSGSVQPTNDMMLTTDGSFIFISQFSPPDQSKIYKYDTNLSLISSHTTSTLAHNNLGSCVYQEGDFKMFSGSKFGFNSNFILTRWTADFSPNAASVQTLISNSGGDGNFFSTGVAYDASNEQWYLGMNHVESGQSIGQEHIDIMAFDRNFNLLERKHLTSQGFFRPHFVFKNGFLYISYDNGNSEVYLQKYSVQKINIVTGIAEEKTLTSKNLFPNPFTHSATLQIENRIDNAELSIYNMLGQRMRITKNISGESIQLEKADLLPGIYFYELKQTDSKALTGKFVIE